LKSFFFHFENLKFFLFQIKFKTKKYWNFIFIILLSKIYFYYHSIENKQKQQKFTLLLY